MCGAARHRRADLGGRQTGIWVSPTGCGCNDASPWPRRHDASPRIAGGRSDCYRGFAEERCRPVIALRKPHGILLSAAAVLGTWCRAAACLTDAEVDAGRALFATCAECHVIDRLDQGKPNRIWLSGPDGFPKFRRDASADEPNRR